MSRPLAGLLGDVRAAGVVRYDARDSAGNRMDTAKVIGGPAGGYLAVYHSGEVCHLATSSDLMDWTHRAVVDFQARNARRRPIEPVLGAAATYISTTVTDFVPLTELLRQHPPGSVVLTLSTPSYPAPRLAVIAYASGGIVGAARLARRSDGLWTVAADRSGVVD